MNLANWYRAELARVAFLNEQFDAMTARINTTWAVQHNADGTHKSLTTDTLAVSGAETIGGSLTVTGAFGCNGKTAQAGVTAGAAPAAYVTGAFGLDSDANMHAFYDLVIAMRAALLANGILK